MSSSEVSGSRNQINDENSSNSAESIQNIDFELVSNEASLNASDVRLDQEIQEMIPAENREVPSTAFFSHLLSRLRTSTLNLGLISTAKAHARSLKVYQRSSLSKTEIDEQERCPCCDSHIYSSYIFPYCASAYDLCEIGKSHAFFFKISKSALLILAVLLPACIYTMVTSVLADPEDPFTDASLVIELTPGNMGKDADFFEYQILHLVTFLVLAVVSVVVYTKAKKRSLLFSLFQIDAADFTAMITGLPSDFTDGELIDFLGTDEIDSIIRTYDIKQAVSLSQQLYKSKKQFHTHNFSESFGRQTVVSGRSGEFEDKLRTLKKEKAEAVKAAIDKINHIAFVTFSKISAAKASIENNRTSFTQHLCELFKTQVLKHKSHNMMRKEHLLGIHQASHPSDIIWENLSTSTLDRWRSTFLTYSASLLLLIAVTAFLIIVKVYQNELRDGEKEDHVLYWVYLIFPSLCLTILNLLLEVFLDKVTKYELHLNKTSKKISTTHKLIVLLCLNTAVVPVIVNTYTGPEFFGEIGLINDAILVIFLNSIITPLLYLCNWRLVVKWVQKKYIERRGNKAKMQLELNQIYKPIKLNITERYAQVISMVYVALFFSPLLPIGVPIVIVGVILEYLITKYMLLRVHARPKPLNEELGLNMGKWLMFSTIPYAIGIVYFFWHLSDTTWPSYLVLASLLILMATPTTFLISRNYKQYILEKVEHLFKGNINEENFRVYRLFLDTDFERENPMFRHSAIEEWKADLAAHRRQRKPTLVRIHGNFAIVRKAAADSIDNYIKKKKENKMAFGKALVENALGQSSERNKDNAILLTFVKKHLDEYCNSERYSRIMNAQTLFKHMVSSQDLL